MEGKSLFPLMPRKESVKFVSDSVSCVLDSPEVLRVAAFIGVVDAGCLSVGPVDSLQVDAGGHVQGGKVLCEVGQEMAAPV